MPKQSKRQNDKRPMTGSNEQENSQFPEYTANWVVCLLVLSFLVQNAKDVEH